MTARATMLLTFSDGLVRQVSEHISIGYKFFSDDAVPNSDVPIPTLEKVTLLSCLLFQVEIAW